MSMPYELDSPEYWALVEERQRYLYGPGPAVRRALLSVIEHDLENGTWHMRHERAEED